MGNEMDTKGKIFTLLKESDDILSGERISAELGVSRVTVWKHVKKMVNAGIPITSSSKGYRLRSNPDSLNPMEFGDRADRVHYFQDTSSTMDEATTVARNGCPDFTVIVADRQTGGRGRMARVWFSDRGGLYFTIVVRPDVPIIHASLINLAAAVEMTRLLRSSYDVPASLKWPNDILVNGMKICGFLSRMETEGDQIRHLSIGVGLNVNNDPEKVEPVAVSLKALLERTIPRREILVTFLDRFEKRLEQFDAQSVIDDWRANNITIGRQVTVKTMKKTVEGLATGIDSIGGLILQFADGTRETIVHGDCFQS
jgi:BirA family biotin operon repressor/biotin-[acetyl-CoA-carboxylase] ligase